MDFSNISDREQREYIRARLELEDLERKEVLSDEEYADRYINVRNTGDQESLRQFSDTYVPRSYYENQKNKLEETINRINGLDERINIDRLNYEKHERANREREHLRKIKAYYHNMNYEIMRNINIEELSDDAVIALYRVIASGANREELDKIINSDVVSVDNLEATNNRIRLYTRYYDKVAKEINKFKGSLVLDDNISPDLNTTIKSINTEFKRLDDFSKAIIIELDNLKKLNINGSIGITPLEIKKQISDLKEQFKALKKSQIDKYNAKVDATNKRVFELKNKRNLNKKTMAIINNLVSLNRCNTNITKWDQSSYLSLMDYEALIETNKIIEKIEKELDIKEDKVNFESDIEFIKNQLVGITLKLKGTNAAEKLSFIKQDVDHLKDNVNELKFKIEANKESIDEREYKNYLDIIAKVEEKIKEFEAATTKKDISEYKQLLIQIQDISKETDSIYSLVMAISEKVEQEKLEIFAGKLNSLNTKLDDIFEVINKKYADKELDDTQYSNLKDKYNEALNKINELKNKVEGMHEEIKKEEPAKNVVEEEELADLPIDQKISSIEKGIAGLEKRINILDKPIKNEKIINWINNYIESIEKEINKLIENLRNDKENDNSDKIDKLTGLENKLAAVTSNYRNNINKSKSNRTPLKVTEIKDAKEFYKKHKKPILIAAGLASLALLYATIGPLVIPMIIKGNLIMMNKATGTRPILKSINEILAKAIGAKKVTTSVINNGVVYSGKVWQLLNGAQITVEAATSTLLQGIALSSIGSTILGAPAVVAVIKSVKALNKKMKNIKEEETMEDVTIESKEENKEKNKTPLLESEIKKKDTNALFNEWIFNALYDFDNFCDNYKLNDEEKEELRRKLISKGMLPDDEKVKRGR